MNRLNPPSAAFSEQNDGRWQKAVQEFQYFLSRERYCMASMM